MKPLAVLVAPSTRVALGSAMAVLVLVAIAIIVALLVRLTDGFAETDQ